MLIICTSIFGRNRTCCLDQIRLVKLCFVVDELIYVDLLLYNYVIIMSGVGVRLVYLRTGFLMCM